MTPVYAIALVVGIVALIGWTVAVAIGASVAGWERADPERRFGTAGRFTLAGVLGFGMAGMSATFAGWPAAAAGVAAIAGTVGLIIVARFFGPEQRTL